MIVLVIRNEWFEFEFFYLLLFSSALTEKSLVFVLLLCHRTYMRLFYVNRTVYSWERTEKLCFSCFYNVIKQYKKSSLTRSMWNTKEIREIILMQQKDRMRMSFFTKIIQQRSKTWIMCRASIDSFFILNFDVLLQQ
jgi:hypothetical protein